ncbi:uncharacterized protein LOC131006804 [Salvia miltiorrhiza]|uniref:uncharacterized protein LOC131006804 n=1 Tax=Salvia miltiorrhiza TaxID=226208 RepID=UPI0025ACA8FD|nr:uncharacterized protein LOC131006804 [Salvia miltiorrhiza]XP_057789936.1 uncharacterized protein LOC131006804 [Salvia miltiorrhiza]XP_057789937.1 uncharacterized protein LOC131006804 [Salvia miltiorrhiza]
MHVTSKMGFHSNGGEESYDTKASKLNIGLSTQPKQRKKLGSILNLEEYENDLHPRAVKDAEKSKGFHQKQHDERKLCKSEEVVRYMSCLPSYLERGENPEKLFNIGVLDWGQLEKWQHSNADILGINVEPSPSSSTSSSFVSSKASSSRPSSKNTMSHHHRKLNRPSTSTGCRSSALELLAGGGETLPKHRNDSNNLLRVQQDLLQATQSSNLDRANWQKDSRRLDPSLQKVTKLRSRPSETDSIVSGFKGNGTLRKGEASKAKEQVRSSGINALDSSERCKTRVPKSTNDPGHGHFAACHQSDSSESDKSRLLEENHFDGGPDAKVSHNNLRSDDNHFYSMFNEHGKTRDSQVEKSFKEVRRLDSQSGEEHTIPFTQSVSISPARRRNLEKKNSVSKPRNLAQDEIIQMKVDGLESTKVRNPSPTRRFTFGKSSNSNSSDIPTQVLDILPDSKATSTSACSNYSAGGKSNATSRARSSPLRRLLDPLLKPKGVESREFARSSERNPSARERSLKSSSGQRESRALLSVKSTVDLKCFRKDHIGRSHHTQKNGTSSMQALLQIAVTTNGLPLFKFTVDNCRDILAATVKELSSKEHMRGWIYTFFSFSDTKKKHAQWINQGSKDNNQSIVSNIVAQMKVSDIVDTDSTGKRHDKSSGREFVLSAVGSREADQTADCLPCDELAAVVVKYPERVCGQLNQSTRGLKEPFQRGIERSSSRDDEGNESGSDGPFSTTVILPGGHHGVPSKGEPSPLIKRWKSGGSCDCGGWDLGCQLTVLAGSNQRFNSIKSHQSTAVKLFSQEEGERPMFVLSPFEEGIFSIEFDSSLKLIQAFSIAIAVAHSGRSVLLSSRVVGETENSVSKIINRAQVEVTAKYASNPPLSPVARV